MPLPLLSRSLVSISLVGASCRTHVRQGTQGGKSRLPQCQASELLDHVLDEVHKFHKFHKVYSAPHCRKCHDHSPPPNERFLGALGVKGQFACGLRACGLVSGCFCAATTAVYHSRSSNPPISHSFPHNERPAGHCTVGLLATKISNLHSTKILLSLNVIRHHHPPRRESAPVSATATLHPARETGAS